MSDDDVIGLAWADRISFEEIKKRQAQMKKKLLKLWEQTLKKSYLLWRTRVRGRITKHRKLFKSKILN